MFELLQQPWPWYVAGPLIGLIVPILFFVGNKSFGISSNFRHLCAMCLPGNIKFFQYDWKEKGSWNLVFVAGIIIGGFLGGWILNNPEPVNISSTTIAELQALGVNSFSELIPLDLFNWANLLTIPGLIVMVLGGFLVGFGTRYAGGCTSGHGITGLGNLQLASLLAVLGFFAGGLVVTHFIFPVIFG